MVATFAVVEVIEEVITFVKCLEQKEQVIVSSSRFKWDPSFSFVRCLGYLTCSWIKIAETEQRVIAGEFLVDLFTERLKNSREKVSSILQADSVGKIVDLCCIVHTYGQIYPFVPTPS